MKKNPHNDPSLANWKGYFPAIVTPFKKDLSLDFNTLAKLLNWLIKESMHGFVIAGTTGEWTSLSQSERESLFESCRNIVPKNFPLIAGCSALRMEETLGYMDKAHQLNYSGILITIPPYVCPTDQEILNFFQTIAAHSTLPMIIYNWPQGTGIDLSEELIGTLIKLDPVVGIKNSTPNQNHFFNVLQKFHHQSLIFGIMPGKKGLENITQIGGAGCIGASGVLGKKQPGFFEAIWKGNESEAKRLGSLDEKLMKNLFSGFRGKYGHAISTIKYLLAQQGLCEEFVRPPLLRLSKNNQEKVNAIIHNLGLFNHE